MADNYPYQKLYMQVACEEARAGIESKEGGPFGAVIVRDNYILGSGHNQVVLNNDPTSHGEIQAIREACKQIKSFDLKGSVLYTTAEPCPMCLAACMWAHISYIYYGCSIEDTAELGFADEHMNTILGTDRSHPEFKAWMAQKDVDMCRKLFQEYRNFEHTMY